MYRMTVSLKSSYIMVTLSSMALCLIFKPFDPDIKKPFKDTIKLSQVQVYSNINVL